MQQGGWANENNLSTPNGSNVNTGASASTISVVDVQTPGTLLNEINNESSASANKINNESSAGSNIKNNHQGGGYNVNYPSTPNATGPNRGSNVATGASASTIAVEDGQRPGTFLKKINK